MGKYEIRGTSNSQFRWTFRAKNGEIIMTSETYTTKSGCLNGIARSKSNVSDHNFSRRSSVRNEPYFVQVSSGNFEPLATSEMYSSAYNREHAISVVKAEAPTAQVEDKS